MMKNYLKDKRGKSSNLYPLYQTLILVRRIFKCFAFLCDMKFSRGSLIFGNNNIADSKKFLKFKSAKVVVRERQKRNVNRVSKFVCLASVSK